MLFQVTLDILKLSGFRNSSEIRNVIRIRTVAFKALGIRTSRREDKTRQRRRIATIVWSTFFAFVRIAPPPSSLPPASAFRSIATRVFVRSVSAGPPGAIARRKHTERWARMTGRKSKTLAASSVVLQKVAAEIPASPEDLRVLECYLEVMGCSGLLSVPWAFQSEALAAELVGAPANQYDGRIRAHPEDWTDSAWRETYNFREGDVKVVERNDDFLKGEFIRTANPKDGYSVADLKDPDARLVIAFLNPIFHPEKPRRVVAKLASLFIGAMRGKHLVDWAALMADQVDRMVRNLPKTRRTATPVSTYVAHLYHKKGLLTPEESDEFDKLLSIQSYGGCETESDKEDSSDEDSPPPSPLIRRDRKRSRSVQKEPEAGECSQRPEQKEAPLPEESQPYITALRITTGPDGDGTGTIRGTQDDRKHPGRHQNALHPHRLALQVPRVADAGKDFHDLSYHGSGRVKGRHRPLPPA